MGVYIGLIVTLVFTIISGVYLGNMERREKQEKYCPFCSCRERCSIGHEVSAMCDDEGQRPFNCM